MPVLGIAPLGRKGGPLRCCRFARERCWRGGSRCRIRLEGGGKAKEYARFADGELDDLKAGGTSLILLGVLHCVGNCAEDLGVGLEGWLGGLTHGCRMFTHRWTNSRSLSTCFVELTCSRLPPRRQALRLSRVPWAIRDAF